MKRMSQNDINWRVDQVKKFAYCDLNYHYKKASDAKHQAFARCKAIFYDLPGYNWSTSYYGIVAASGFNFTFVGLTEKVLFVATRCYYKVVDLETREITFL